MRIDNDGDLSNIEDRRGQGGGGGGSGGGIKLGFGGMVIVGILSLVFRRNLFSTIGGGQDGSASPAADSQRDPASEERAKKVAVFAFNDSQKLWASETPQEHVAYRPAKMVLFWDGTRSGCGDADAQVGPFYCPTDEKVYLDLGFFNELATKFGSPGEFAQAYVVAHEVGHHVQKVLGIEGKMRQLQSRSPERKNELSERLELQADCFAGIWGHSTNSRHLLDPGDMDAGLRAAASIGDDKLQKQAGGSVRPERFTHGTSEQRKRWLTRGLTTGKIEDCDTFAAASF
ncbi:MAG: neutral zinc metallopeptidase [Byssovorax sp.]